mmetsp:Transcript_8446/g.26064  ORF Transcript_8446/g.26064 Transcript_8446/m.26064 type:complete len:250 (-) Transcript_8446:336-1085(-)
MPAPTASAMVGGGAPARGTSWWRASPPAAAAMALPFAVGAVAAPLPQLPTHGVATSSVRLSAVDGQKVTAATLSAPCVRVAAAAAASAVAATPAAPDKAELTGRTRPTASMLCTGGVAPSTVAASLGPLSRSDADRHASLPICSGAACVSAPTGPPSGRMAKRCAVPRAVHAASHMPRESKARLATCASVTPRCSLYRWLHAPCGTLSKALSAPVTGRRAKTLMLCPLTDAVASKSPLGEKASVARGLS